jgi:hypothetical protein
MVFPPFNHDRVVLVRGWINKPKPLTIVLLLKPIII